jgi:hypothetical protein
MLNDILRWAMDINAARGRIPRGLAEPTWPAARDDSDPRSFVQARSSASVTRTLDPLPCAEDPGTHVAFQIIITNVRLDAHKVAQHPPHDVFAKDNNLLIEESYPTRVRGQV